MLFHPSGWPCHPSFLAWRVALICMNFLHHVCTAACAERGRNGAWQKVKNPAHLGSSYGVIQLSPSFWRGEIKVWCRIAKQQQEQISSNFAQILFSGICIVEFEILALLGLTEKTKRMAGHLQSKCRSISQGKGAGSRYSSKREFEILVAWVCAQALSGKVHVC